MSSSPLAVAARARSGVNSRPEHRVRLERHRRRFALLLAGPSLVLITLFTLVPLAGAIVLSFTSYSLFRAPTFVGLRNYRTLFADPTFWTAVRNTVVFAASQVVVGIVVAVLVAVLFNQGLRGGALMRTIVYLPQAASYVVVALVWNLLLDPAAGPVSRVAQDLVGHPVSVLTSSHGAMPAIVVMSLWRNLGYFVVIILAALQSVPHELLEAGEVDGANAVQRFRWITVPEIVPVIGFVALTWFLGALQMFTQSYIMTQGGPVNATRTVVYIMYDLAFSQLDLGQASAIAALLFGTVAVVALGARLIGWVTR